MFGIIFLVAYILVIFKACESWLWRVIWFGAGGYVFFFQTAWATPFFIGVIILLAIAGSIKQVTGGMSKM
jgi:hypothetical protein